MKIIPVDLPNELKNLELFSVCDLHIGDKAVDLPLFKKTRDYILYNSNAFCLLNGDLFNMATKNSPSNVYNDTHSPGDQFSVIKELIKPLVDAGKVWAIGDGNHEYRSEKEVDLNVTKLLAESLGIGDKYCENEGVIKLTFGKGYNGKKICYLIYFTHGNGGGKKPGSSLNNLVDLSQSIDCDIYIVGHSHKRTAHKNSFRRIDTRNNCVTEHERLFVISSSFTSYGGYAARGMMIPSAKGAVPILLSGSEKAFYGQV